MGEGDGAHDARAAPPRSSSPTAVARSPSPADELVPAKTYAKDPAWGEATQSRALTTWTHALLEAGRPIFGLRNGRDFTGDADVLRAVGITVGVVLHGSEIRNPSRHASWTPWSPFRDPAEELTARLQSGA